MHNAQCTMVNALIAEPFGFRGLAAAAGCSMVTTSSSSEEFSLRRQVKMCLLCLVCMLPGVSQQICSEQPAYRPWSSHERMLTGTGLGLLRSKKSFALLGLQMSIMKDIYVELCEHGYLLPNTQHAHAHIIWYDVGMARCSSSPPPVARESFSGSESSSEGDSSKASK